MGLVIVTPPAAEPVTLEEVKEELRIQHDDDDARLDRLITEASLRSRATAQDSGEVDKAT